MKIIVAAVALACCSTAALAQAPYGTTPGYGGYGSSGGYGTGSNPNAHTVQPYTTQSGTYVPGHVQTNPNSTTSDNYGTRGNYNPNSGMYGTRSPGR